jgi:hypothetical protein
MYSSKPDTGFETLTGRRRTATALLGPDPKSDPALLEGFNHRGFERRADRHPTTATRSWATIRGARYELPAAERASMLLPNTGRTASSYQRMRHAINELFDLNA